MNEEEYWFYLEELYIQELLTKLENEFYYDR